jgi:Flp pilus assembly protein TadD
VGFPQIYNGDVLLLLPLLLPLLNASDVISEACVSKFRAFEYAGAISACEHAVRSDPANLEVRVALAVSHACLGDTASAAAVIEHALPRFPNSVELLLNLAEIRLIENTPMAAIGLFEKVAGINPKETRAWGGLVRAHRLSLEMPAGRPVPTPWAQWKLLGDRLMQQQKFPLALHAYRRALALQPAMADVHAAIADLDRRTGHADWADYEHRLEPGPGPSVKAVRDAAAEAYRRLESFGASADLMDL